MPMPMTSEFQSAPAECRRENAACRPQCSVRRCRFNPLPPTVGGRMPGRCRPKPRCMFQSAPADCRRENARATSGARGSRFNPLPPTVGGRIASIGETGSADDVSIRSRRMSAGECPEPLSPRRVPSRFNPLPPTVGGRMRRAADRSRAGFNPLPPNVGGRMACHCPDRVSIRSRRLSAGECLAVRPVAEFVSIRSRRMSAGESGCRLRPHGVRFNPLPPTVGGRISGWSTRPLILGFNPLPPTVGGRMLPRSA